MPKQNWGMKKTLLFALAILVAPTPVAAQSNVDTESGIDFTLRDLCWKTYSEILGEMATFCGSNASNRRRPGWIVGPEGTLPA